jgi:hypothetical protein
VRHGGAIRVRHLHHAVAAFRDLYDRFAAPIEERYSERGATALVEQAGCRVHAVANIRGWAVWGEKL